MMIVDPTALNQSEPQIIPYDFEVVRKVYPQVTSMCSQNGAWDADGNEVELDFSLLDPHVAAHETESAGGSCELNEIIG